MKKTVIIGGNTGIGKVIYNTLKKRGDKIVKISRTQFNQKSNLSADISSVDGLSKIKKIFYKKKLTILFLHKDIVETILSMNIKLWLKLQII